MRPLAPQVLLRHVLLELELLLRPVAIQQFLSAPADVAVEVFLMSALHFVHLQLQQIFGFVVVVHQFVD